MLNCDQYLTPQTLDEAFDLMEAHRGGCRLVAGATDLLPWARDGRAGDVHYDALIDISRIPDLQGVSAGGGNLSIGAATVFQRFMTDPVLRNHAPVMPHVAVWFADNQLRESATIGGNIINASPAADGTPGLMCMNGAVVLNSRSSGERRMSITDFILGPGETDLRDEEILCRIECESTEDFGASFQKVGHRRSLVISTVCLATLVKIDADTGCFTDVRLTLAGTGPIPVRLGECEEALIGKPVSTDLIEEVAHLPVNRVQSRTRQDYRREVVVNFVRRGLIEALRSLGLDLEETMDFTGEAAHG
jgi:CO/xanthine dehydrogenase FAD-binding subunit